MKRLKNKGFTLVELLAVIVVLAIIMVIAVPSVTTSLNKAKKSSFLLYAQKMLNAAEQQYETDQLDGSMPSEYCYNIEYLSGGKSSKYKGFVRVAVEDYEIKSYISMFDDNYSIGILLRDSTSSSDCAAVYNKRNYCLPGGMSFAGVESLKNNTTGVTDGDSTPVLHTGGAYRLYSPCGYDGTNKEGLNTSGSGAINADLPYKDIIALPITH